MAVRATLAALASVAAIVSFVEAVHAATSGDPPPEPTPPIETAPAVVILRVAIQVAPFVAFGLALLFRAGLRAADGGRIKPVLAIRWLLVAGLVALPLGIVAVPICAQFDSHTFLPGFMCVVPGIVLAAVGATSFILHALLARLFAGRPALAAGLAVALSVPVILAYSILDSAILSSLSG